jgi:mRNA interferase MazF
MGRFVKGEVVVVPFPYSDLSQSKKRPACVIAAAGPYDDVLLCMITSRGMGDERAVAISQQDFVEGGLPLDSNVRPNRLFTANEQIILKTVGRLSHEAMNDVVNEVVQLVTA